MGQAIIARTPDDVIDMFAQHGKPYFSLWEGKNNLIFSFDQDDEAAAEQALRDNLMYIQRGGSNAVYTVRVYNDGNNITNQKAYRGSIPFRFEPQQGYTKDGNVIILQQPGAQAPAANVGAGPAVSTVEQKLDRLIELMLLQQQQQMEDQDDDDDDDDEEVEETELEKVERIGSIVNTVLTTASPIIEGILSRFFPTKSNIGNMNNQINQQPISDQELQQSIQTIMQCLGDAEFRRVMVKLAELASNDPNKLKMLTTMI